MTKLSMNNFLAMCVVIMLLCFFFAAYAEAGRIKKAPSQQPQYNSTEQYYIDLAKKHEIIHRTWGRRAPIGHGGGFYGRDTRRRTNRRSFTGPHWNDRTVIIDRR